VAGGPTWNLSAVVDLGTSAAAPEVEPPGGPDLRFGFNAHEWGVLLPLSLIGFFLNYDTGLLTLAAPAIAEGLDVSVARFGIGVAVIRLAALGSLPVLRFADRVGRRQMLLVSVLAFTVATAATSLAWGIASFVVFQMIARLFLATEESLGGIVISEEVRPDRRGGGLTLLGIIAMTGFGLVAVMLLVVPLTSLGWRILYVAALPPLLLVAWLRRNLRETTAFTVAQAEDRVQGSFWPHVDRAHRPYLWRITVVLGTHGLLGTPMFFYAAELAQDGYGWEGLFTVIVIAAGPATLLGYVAGGRLSDRIGRKPVVLWSSLIVIFGVLLVFSEERWLFAPGFFLLTGADAGLTAVRPAYLSELFPTEVRATLLAFVLAVIVAAGSLGLVIVGLLEGVLSTRASVLGLTAVMLAGLLALRPLPETAGADVVSTPVRV
jgi:SHS family lactate transporter-like MFS transporter